MAKKSNSLNNAGFIRKILKEEGYSESGIRGALARMRQESNLNPKAFRANDAGQGKHSKGIFQWNRERLAGLERFARRMGRSPDDLEAQVRWFVEEGKTTERQYGERLKHARTDDEAARMAISMARPAGWKSSNPTAGHGWNNTISWAKNWAAKQTGESTEYYGRPDLDPSLREAQSSHAGKALGRLKEEGEFTPQMLTALDEVLSNDAAVQENLPEIDNSPGAVARQTVMGFFQAVAKGVEATEKADDVAQPEVGVFNISKEIRGTGQSSPGASQITAMIRGMV